MRLSHLLTKASYLLLIGSLFTLQSCDESTTETGDDTQEDSPTITISEIESSASTVSFILTTENATRLKYAVTLSGQEEQMIEVLSSKEQDISITDLEVGAEYTISAYAYSRDDVESQLAEATFTTEDQITYPRNMLALKFTGTWCSICPYMTAAIEEANQELEDKIHVVAIHCETSGAKYQYQCDGGLELISDYSVTSYPTTIFDYRETCSYSSSDMVAIYNSAVKKYNATSDMAITSQVVDGVISIDVDVVVGASARYALGVVITENDIEIANTDGSEDGLYHHVSRDFVTSVYGDSIGTLAKGDTVTCNFEHAIDDDWNENNLEVVVFIQKEESVNQFYTNNVKTIPVNGSVDFSEVE